jgi:hypothetical protein
MLESFQEYHLSSYLCLHSILIYLHPPLACCLLGSNNILKTLCSIFFSLLVKQIKQRQVTTIYISKCETGGANILNCVTGSIALPALN